MKCPGFPWVAVVGVFALVLSGCVTSSPDVLLSPRASLPAPEQTVPTQTLPDVPASPPLQTSAQPASPELSSTPVGAPRTTGNFPDVNAPRRAQTQQLTKEQAAQAKAELAAAAAPNQAQAEANNPKSYKREVKALQNLAKQQKKKRLAEIKANSQ